MTDMATPPASCWLTDAVMMARSAIEGFGLFPVRPIAAAEPVARFGGQLVSDAELETLLAESTTYVDTLSVYPGRNLVLPRDNPNHAGNHSCNPNTWWTDPFSVVARHDIGPGQEITLDYGTITDAPAFTMSCRCGSANCRDVVTGRDWQITSLKRAYGGHWVPVLRDRIANETFR
jgi:hypothetical protein